ncbi:transaldolase [Pelagicoccus enzymogenes]|uniref:transaldolase n=1 Tax=Pelagicoccus enzymogenes TaxID=2773457 RepID=UPI00280EE452|nr:transaldolase [Pelagicoccus enzymogenes]MDQ8200650.1 transaldolase [Pelagicoccus enzymogenes]
MSNKTMDTERIRRLSDYGQSFWLDNLTREMLHDGELKARIKEEGLRGVTSNPKTFSDSVRSGKLYNEDIESLVNQGETNEAIYEALMVSDVQKACDAFRDLYESSAKIDGYVSIEVDPRLAHDPDGTLEAARNLWESVDRPNAMIKIPGTASCLPVIEQALYEGINVNVTLLFSVSRYREVAACYLRALRRRVRDGRDVKGLASVASFFLSRIDSKLESYLDDAAKSPDKRELTQSLRGTVAIAQARAAFESYSESYSNTAWKESLQKDGALPQRLLWASTSVKNKAYPETYYVDSLVGEGTVNTMPESTVRAFAEAGNLEKNAIDKAGEEPSKVFDSLEKLGIDLEVVSQELEDEGVQKFVDAFETGLRSVVRQAKQLRGAAV